MYKHVLETLGEYKDNKIMKSIVDRKNINEAEDEAKKMKPGKDNQPPKKKNDSSEDKIAREQAIDAKTTLGLLNQNWKNFEMTSKGDMAAYKAMWSSFNKIKEKLASNGIIASDVYRLFGSLKKEKNGVSYQPGNFTVISTKGKKGPRLVIINHDKGMFDGKSVLLDIPGEEGVSQFAEFIKGVKSAAKSAKENYVSTTLRKKKDDIFAAMSKGIAKKSEASADKKIEESGEAGEGDKEKSKKKGNPNFKKGEKPNFEKKTKDETPEKGKKGVNPFPKSGIEN